MSALDFSMQKKLWATLARLGLNQPTLEYKLYDGVYGLGSSSEKWGSKYYG